MIPISGKVCFDPNLRLRMWSIEEARQALEKIWPLVDLALPGVEEGALLFGCDNPDQIAEILQKKYGVSTVVIKIGKDGAIGYEGGERVQVPGFPVSHVADAFGAGDAFCAGILSGRLKGWPLKDTIRWANAIGALTVSAHGNIEAMPDAAQVEAFLHGRQEPDR